MTVRRFSTHFGYSTIGVFLLMSAGPSRALAHDGHTHSATSQHHQPAQDQKNQTGEFVKVVRDSTRRFRDVSQAEAEGYGLLFGCVSGPDVGAMGLHYVNLELAFDGGELDATRPEIVIYEPEPNGRLRMTGADYLVIAKDWDDKHAGPPELMGQLFHLFESPNRFGLPAFYTLHVWAWKDNPSGTFVNWHPKVSCDGFSGSQQ